MKLDIDFQDLEKLVSNMGASPIEWKSNVTIKVIESDWRIQLETKGIDVAIDDIFIESSGLIKYNGEQILLHIKEVSSFGQRDQLPKFHFYDCNTLKKMRSSGRFDRYVVTQRKDGTFLVDKKLNDYFYHRDCIIELHCCKNCLNWYNRNYQNSCTVDDFDIESFFQKVSNTPIARKPIYTDLTAPASGYTKDWSDVSLRMREKYRWFCQKCYKNYNRDRSYFQVHHINGIKSDNCESNLKVLCKSCHAQEPYHEHMRNL